jgi:Ca2+-binding EF-hand superfamily protein
MEISQMKALRSASIASWTLLAAALAGGAAHAQPTPVREEVVAAAVKAGDVDNDGSIDIDEFVAYEIQLFTAADKNRDRFLSPQEAGAAEAQFRAADRNNDGRLSLGEAVASKVIDFFEIDVNKDGVITVQEIMVYERAPAAK